MEAFTCTPEYTEDTRRNALLADIRGGLDGASWGTVLLVTRDVSTDTLDAILGAVPWKDIAKDEQTFWLLLLLQGARFEARSRS